MSLSIEHHHSSLSVGQRASPKRHQTALSFDEKANAIANLRQCPHRIFVEKRNQRLTPAQLDCGVFFMLSVGQGWREFSSDKPRKNSPDQDVDNSVIGADDHHLGTKQRNSPTGTMASGAAAIGPLKSEEANSSSAV
jgi:hypothetical protein